MLFHTETQQSAHYIKDILLTSYNHAWNYSNRGREFLHINLEPFFFFSSSFIYSVNLLCIYIFFFFNLVYFGNCNTIPRSICKTAYTKTHWKSFSWISPPGEVKPDFSCWQGQVHFLHEDLVSELLIAAFLNPTRLAFGQKMHILGFSILRALLGRALPDGMTC